MPQSIRRACSLLLLTFVALQWHTTGFGRKTPRRAWSLASLKEGGLDVYDLSGLVQHVAPDAARREGLNPSNSALTR